jgi:hypothetical protein
MLLDLQYFLMPEKKKLANQPLNAAWLTQAFLFDSQMAGSDQWL